MEGVSNIYIEEVLLPRTKYFKGCYACNEIPTFLRHEKKFSVIINLSRANEKGTHWVAVYKDHGTLIYYDPVGFPLINSDIKLFLNSISQEHQHNLFEYQCIYSKLCGYFVMLFTLLLERDMSFTQFRNLFSNKCAKNNRIVIDLLKYTIEQLYFLCIINYDISLV